MPRLTYTLDGREHTVDVGDSCSIGRAAQNDVPLESEVGASRRHCQIMKLAKTYELTDLGSTNGTRVNGQKVQRHRLAHGDRIAIGDTELVWAEHDDGDVEIEEEISIGSAPAPKRAAGGSGEQCYVVYAGGDRDGQRLALDKPRITFGRRSSNTVVIESAAVSGYHCEIAREGGGYVLRDLGSTNGTLLDGELVTEAPLSHGARIRVGDQRLVFVDPSISDFEKAMASVDDLGSEWGMLRAEMDMTRVQRARRSQIVAVVAVFAVLGVLAFVFVNNPEMFADKAPKLETVEGNVAEDPSFESPGSGWTPEAGGPVAGSYGTDAPRQGTSCYGVSRDGGEGRPAVVEYAAKDYTVSPGKAYRFGAFVRARNGAAGGVRIRWTGTGPGEGGLVARRMNATPFVTASEWTEVSATVVPPSSASGARIQLVNYGGGRADFDDVFFVPGGTDATRTVSDGGISLTVAGDGAVTVKRDADVLLEDLQVVGGVFGKGADFKAIPDRAGTAALRSIDASGASVKLSGQLFDPYAGSASEFQVEIGVTEARFVELRGTLPEWAGLVGVVPKSALEKGVGVWTEAGSFRESQTRFVQSARRVSVGNTKRYEIGSDGPFRFALLADGDAAALAVGAPTGAPLAVRFDTDAKALDIVRDRLRSEAESAKAQRNFGVAIAKYRDLANEFPEGDARQQDALRQADGLEADRDARLARVRVVAEGAIQYGERAGLEEARDECIALRESFGSTDAEQLLVRVQEALAKRSRQLAEAAAAPLVDKAADFRKNGMKRLARAAYEDIVKRYPDTPAAVEAAAALRELGQ